MTEERQMPMMASIDAHLRKLVYAAIDRERDYQDRKWGDKPHTIGEWLLIMEAELDEAKAAWSKGVGDDDAKRELLQVIAVGVAALEQHDIIERKAELVAGAEGSDGE